MRAIAETLAQWLGEILPAWLAMPDVTFSPPHWVYWLGLVLFPAVAIFLTRRAEAEEPDAPRVRLSIAGLLWVCGGFAGLHRFYLRSAKVALLFVALFLLVLYGNDVTGTVRNAQSNASNEVRSQSFLVERYTRRVEQGRRGAEEDLREAQTALAAAQTAETEAQQVYDDWRAFSGFFGALILLLMLHDLVRMGALYRRCLEIEAREPPPDEEIEIIERGTGYDPRNEITNPVSDFVDKISGWTGRYVAYWSVIAVFVYYFEVISRYVFNSPTNWAHEGMYLMFGMQYVLSGAYALRENAHVRVDVLYERFSFRTRAKLDLMTSIVFFIFTGTLLVTGIMFASQSIGDAEVSFNEWQIQYWPAKSMIAVGALLLLAQGIAQVIRDVHFLRSTRGTEGS